MMLEGVRAGEWGAGETLPNEFSLAARFDVSIGTIRRAVSELETIGVLVRQQGRGTFVAGTGNTALRDRFLRLSTVEGGKLVPAYTLQSIRRRPADCMERTRLRGGAVQGVIEIVQTLVHDARTVGIECSVLPSSRFPKLESQFLFGQHLYEVMAGYGCLVTRVEETIGAEAAEPDLAAPLATETDCSMLTVTRCAFDMDDTPTEWRTARYLASVVRYTAG
jgi:GntR family transcriptional regulator